VSAPLNLKYLFCNRLGSFWRRDGPESLPVEKQNLGRQCSRPPSMSRKLATCKSVRKLLHNIGAPNLRPGTDAARPRPLRSSLRPHSIGFAREHRAPRQRGRLWITIQDPADEMGRQPCEMDQVADIVVGDVFTYRNFRHRLRFACCEIFEPD
jgi:hypothetical protein